MIEPIPKISIITVCYNSVKTIKDTIESVLNQTYKNIEYIIIDGGSTDGTIDLVKNYGNKITKFISEPDRGIYDAMNKGILVATGDVVGILNSDDFYASNSVIENVVYNFSNNDIQCLYGDLVYVKHQNVNKVIRYWKSGPFKQKLFQNGWHPAHPTFFVKRQCYQQYGIFDLSFKIAADYELCLRFMERHQLKSIYLNQIMVKMRLGGSSNKNIKNILIANIECYRAWKINSLKVSILFIVKKLFSKIIQFIK